MTAPESSAAASNCDREDAHALTLPDASFDTVLTTLFLSSVPNPSEVASEVYRVLRPGGRLLIADIRGTRRHQARLDEIGMGDVARRRLGWRFWRAGLWAATPLVTATKPERPL